MKGDKDLSAANEIRLVIASALSSMEKTHPELYKDKRFANWAANVMINIICKLAQSVGEPKERIIGIIEDIWNGIENMSKDEDSILN